MNVRLILSTVIPGALLVIGALVLFPGSSEPVKAEGEVQLPLPMSEADFLLYDETRARLGQLLYYDPVLSGNRNISCGTCHHHDLASADGLALGVGEGGQGLGAKRTTGQGAASIHERVPRNAPALFNVGHRQITALFHDGRLSIGDQYGNGFVSPAKEALPKGLNHIVAAQAAFPPTSATEMAGQPGDNEVAEPMTKRMDHGWALLAQRIRGIPAYLPLFTEAYPDVQNPDDIDFVHIANAIGDFVVSEWRSYDSPFDRYLTGDKGALDADAVEGMTLFFGKANCASCHSGQLLSDQDFHAICLPHFGPGKFKAFDNVTRDLGRMAETRKAVDAYRFRTPSLRNAALTAPYGHNGAYATLEGMIRHHLNPEKAFQTWTPSQVVLPTSARLDGTDFVSFRDPRERQLMRSALDIEPVELTDTEVDQLVAFMHALTGGRSVEGRLGRPDSVPSGLPLD